MDKTQAPEGRLSLRQATLHYCLGAAIVCVGNMIAGGLASFRWAGPIPSVGYAALSVRVSGCVLLLGWIVILVIRRSRKARVIVALISVIFVTTTIDSYLQAREPSAARVFESELGFKPDADITDLRSFISRARIRVPTIGLQFRVTESSLARLVRKLRLGEGHEQVGAAAAIHASANRHNPAPSWFAEGGDEVRMKQWKRTDDNGELEVALDQDHMIVYVVRQAR
ncbi:MAG: hypothetical protein H6818_08880 [Phycisphaerales bacterium]|nr:hypothetical protein [Phycisphaerales bacterium]MCB9862684.1 hypothetical protein [Phycisphaerales bacterium]